MFPRLCDQADAGAEGAVSESTQAAVIPGPPGHIRGNNPQKRQRVSDF